MHIVGLKNNLVLQQGRFSLMVFCKGVLNVRNKLPRFGRRINNSFFSTVNATGLCQNFLFKKI